MLKIKENGIKLNGEFWGHNRFPEIEKFEKKKDLSTIDIFALRYAGMEFISETFKEYGEHISRDEIEEGASIQDNSLRLNDFSGYMVGDFLVDSICMTTNNRLVLECYKIDEETGEETDEEINFLLY